MIFKNLTALCRQQKRIYLFGDEEETQWISDGAAIYPLHGMPGMTDKVLPQIFDIPEKDLGKYHIKQEDGLPGGFDYEDVGQKEIMLRPEPWILKRYETILCPVRTSRGLMFYNPDYLKPLLDVQDRLEIYEREHANGTIYFAVKSGFLLQAIILPMRAENGKMLEELLTLCSALQETVEREAAKETAGGA